MQWVDTSHYVATKTSHVGRVKCDRPDQKKQAGSPGWGLGHEADLILVKNINFYANLDESLGDIGSFKIYAAWHERGTKNWNMERVVSV
jgi:hypothetical protein